MIRRLTGRKHNTTWIPLALALLAILALLPGAFTVQASGDSGWALGGTFEKDYSLAGYTWARTPSPFQAYGATNITFIEFVGEIDDWGGTPNGNTADILFRLTENGWRLEFWTFRSDGTARARITPIYLDSPSSSLLLIYLDHGTVFYLFFNLYKGIYYWRDASMTYGGWMNKYYTLFSSANTDISVIPSGFTLSFYDSKIYSDSSWQTPDSICSFHYNIVYQTWYGDSGCKPGTSTVEIKK